MKRLAFTPDRAREYLWTFYALTADDIDRLPLKAHERRLHGKILDRFEAIGVFAPGNADRVLRADGGEVILEDAEHALVVRLYAEFPWKHSISRDVNATEDWLKGAPEYEP